MYLHDYGVWAIAQARHQELLKEAEVNRLLQFQQETDNSEPKFWRQLRWRIGDSMIAVGRRLQAQPECQ
jgi:hypothetical protein